MALFHDYSADRPPDSTGPAVTRIIHADDHMVVALATPYGALKLIVRPEDLTRPPGTIVNYEARVYSDNTDHLPIRDLPIGPILPASYFIQAVREALGSTDDNEPRVDPQATSATVIQLDERRLGGLHYDTKKED